MSDIVGLVLAFFGLIFIGYFVGRIGRQNLDARLDEHFRHLCRAAALFFHPVTALLYAIRQGILPADLFP